MTSLEQKLFSPLYAAFRWARRYPKLHLSLLAVALLGSVLLLRHARVELDIYDTYMAEFQSSRDLWAMREVYQDVNSISLIFSHVERTPKAYCEIKSLVMQEANFSNDVGKVIGPWTPREAKQIGQALFFPTILKDPCLPMTPAEFEADLADLHARPTGQLFDSTDPHEIVVEVEFADREKTGDIGEERTFHVGAVKKLLSRLHESLGQIRPPVELRIVGSGAFRHYVREIMAHDFIFNLGLFVFFLVFFRIFLGTWLAGGLYVLGLVVSVVLMFAFATLMGFAIDVLSNTLFLMTAIAGIADFLFVSFQQKKDGAWEKSMERLLVPGFLTTFTTFIGFGSLVTSDLHIIGHFGVTAAAGALLEWYATFLVTASVLQVFDFQGPWVNPQKAVRLKFLETLAKKNMPRILARLILLASLAGPFMARHLDFADEPLKNFPPSHPLRQAMELFHEHHGWENLLYVQFDNLIEEGDARTFTGQIEKLPDIHHAENPWEIIDDLGRGFSPPYQRLIESEAKTSSFFDRYNSPGGTWRVPLAVKSSSIETTRRLNEAVHNICAPHCRLVGPSMVYLEFNDRISQTLLTSFAVSVVLVIAILFFLVWLRERHYYFRVGFSSVAGPFLVLAMLAIFHVPITVFTSIFLAVLVGMTGDNAIQFLYGSDESIQAGIDDRAPATLTLAVLCCLSSIAFLGQTLMPMKILGVLFFIGFLINIFCDLWVLRGLIGQKYPED